MRGAQRSAPRPSSPAVPALQRRVGVADASAARWPGAALAHANAGPRSAAREHRRRVRRRVRERRDQALQRPRVARSARPRRCRPNSVRPQGVAAASVSEWRRCPGGARGLRVAKRSASFQPARPKALWAAGRCTARDRRRSEEVPLARAVLAPVPSSPRAPEPPGAAPLHGARGRRAVLALGGLFAGAVIHERDYNCHRTSSRTSCHSVDSTCSSPGEKARGSFSRIRRSSSRKALSA